jgi:hypothetical protein
MSLRLPAAALAVLLLAFSAGTVMAAAPGTAPGQNKIVCFQSGAATCTVNTNGAKGSVTFKVTGPGAASAYYVGYNASVYGVKLSSLSLLSFQYTGNAATAGAPRFSIPIDQNNDGYTEAFAFVPAVSCNNGQGKVDVIGDSTCLVYYAPDGVTGWANWAAFAAAHPTYEVAELDNYVFPTADEVGTWTLSQLVIGKSGK